MYGKKERLLKVHNKPNIFHHNSKNGKVKLKEAYIFQWILYVSLKEEVGK